MELYHFYGGFGKGSSARALQKNGAAVLYGRTLYQLAKHFDPTRHTLVILSELPHRHLLPILDHLMQLAKIGQGPRHVVVITDEPPHVALVAYPFRYVAFSTNGPF